MNIANWMRLSIIVSRYFFPFFCFKWKADLKNGHSLKALGRHWDKTFCYFWVDMSILSVCLSLSLVGDKVATHLSFVSFPLHFFSILYFSSVDTKCHCTIILHTMLFPHLLFFSKRRKCPFFCSNIKMMFAEIANQSTKTKMTLSLSQQEIDLRFNHRLKFIPYYPHNVLSINTTTTKYWEIYLEIKKLFPTCCEKLEI